MSKTELAIFQTHQIDALRRALGESWYLNPDGNATSIRSAPGLSEAELKFHFANHATKVFGGHAGQPLVASRQTPESQRRYHLDRLITVKGMDEPVLLGDLISRLYPDQMRGTEVADLPIFDCLAILPWPPQGEKVAYGATLNTPNRHASMEVIEGRNLTARWATPKAIFGLPTGHLSLAAENNGTIEAFTTSGEVDYISADSLLENSITAVVFASDVITLDDLLPPQPSALPKSHYWDMSSEFGSGAKDDVMFKIALAKRGSNEDTGIRSRTAEQHSNLQYGAIINVFTLLQDANQISDQTVALLKGL